MNIKAPKGTQDIMPEEVYKWHFVESKLREICDKFGYKELRTPTFEHTELFKRGVGETTDVVQKEMYTFEDKKGRSITLKPEGTAPVVRSFVEASMASNPQPIKLYYLTPCFRYEKPQAGRLREFHQFGIEAFGSTAPSIDAEVMMLADRVFTEFGIKDVILNINSIGCPTCRAEYQKKLKEFLNDKKSDLCTTCQERFDKNPMRILDCKVESCQEKIVGAPLMLDYICDECREHFEEVKTYLELAEIKYEVNPKIVRGLDYYNKTAFEFISNNIGAQGTVCGGGRYDGLVKQIGGPEVSGIGFGMGIERLILVIENSGITIPRPNDCEVFIVALGENAKKEAFKFVQKLRNKNISADLDHLNRSAKAQFKYSNKIGSKINITIGDNELERNIAMVKQMETGVQEEVSLETLVEYIENITRG